MPSINSTLTCQVNGLVKVYTYNKNVYFAFENEEQLNQAKKKVTQSWDSNDCPFLLQKKPAEPKCPLDLLHSYPKEARFSFGISTKSEKEELIERIARIIHSGMSTKTVPITKINHPEELNYKNMF
ncbi:hypothetical protein [Candidatus Rhabdochlamydia sp. T3358]|uniref:hypothetical protein n=1 Tax=Candidatus Rhabdochlamydia sp. T3358 TaxID=2099795 RepID=UPI0010B2A5BE|nr:hypothetical protein [Candidatus Rhabdochlamydia sp. T3358]VHN99658.1 hypothetical protein RHT_00095 [Candidatus Rhabdochlamydia sp. T3358]